MQDFRLDEKILLDGKKSFLSDIVKVSYDKKIRISNSKT